MHARRALVLLLAAVACGPADEQADSEQTSAARTIDAAHADHGSVEQSGHEGHDTSDAARPDESSHDGHRAIAPTGGAHDAHDATAPGATRSEHAGPAERAGAHAEHARAAEADPGADAAAGHAAHARPSADVSAEHAGHAVPVAEGTSAGQLTPAEHAAHAPAREDAAPAEHAAHAPTREDAAPAEHVGHAPAAQDSAPAAHAEHVRPDAHAAHPDPHAAHAPDAMPDSTHDGGHEMAMVTLGRTGWMAIGMAQAFPTFTVSLPDSEGPLDDTGFYLTQPALMVNLESPQSRVSFRTTLNFEGITQPDGELTFGGWGEGFIDKRHPHTLLHEAMLSVNVWSSDGGGFSLSAGKGFAPYGTDDPMSRPVVKYPTNHHLSQILERFTLNGAYSSPRWSVEAGVFGGNEPDGPYDFSNAESFANSFSTRVARRFGHGAMGIWEWELSGSYGYVLEEHGDEEAATQLFNAALRHEHDHSFGRVYYMTEASMSDPEHHDGYWSVLGEASLFRGAHNPYGRIEYATRPEYQREGAPGSDGFFRYDHDTEPIGSTRWLILTAGYGWTATSLPFSARPYVEVQWNRVSEDEGDIDPDALFGRSSFFSVSLGARVFLGGEPMRMGAYGVLDSITLMHRMMMGDTGPAAHTGH